MKKYNVIIVTLIVITLAFPACKKKDAPKPEEQELITTMKLTITDGGTFNQTFTYKVENGFGSTAAGSVQIDTVRLAAVTTYTVTAELFNDKASPAENVTAEILDEQDEHLFLYSSNPFAGAGSITFSNGSKDVNNAPFNQVITFTTGITGSGTLTVDLMHAPTNKNGNTPASSGGETDAEGIFPVIIQ